jgi:arsenical-resistance protein 2
MTDSQQTASAADPWHAKYPVPTSTPGGISQEHVLAMLKSPSLIAGKDYLLVDVRRNDFEVGS